MRKSSLYIKIEDYCAATGVSTATARRRLADVLFRIPTRGRGQRYYHLAAAVQTLKAKEIDAGAVEMLANAARILDDHLYIESAAMPLAQSFADWLSGAMLDRAHRAQAAFVVAVANSRLCTPSIVRNLDPLKALFLLNPDVLRWIFAGVAAPAIDALAPAFAVACNENALTLYTNNILEAA